MLKSTKTRSLLANNVDVMLENVSAIRQRNKIDSDDLFGAAESDTIAIPWKTQGSNLSDFEILLLEKESLGIYVSGNPLQEYLPIQDWVREVTFSDDIHLVIINKIRKIFTKTNHMMFALDFTTGKDPVEGIIFPKLAPTYSTLLEEKALFWVRGRISQKKKKKQEAPIESVELANDEILTDGLSEVVSDIGDPIKVYDELPKLIVDAICKFDQGPIPLFDDTTSLSVNRIDMINSVDWKYLKTNAKAFGAEDDDTESPLESSKNSSKNTNNHTFQSSSSHTNQKDYSTPDLQKVILKKELGAEKLKQVHQHISREHRPNTLEIELWVETNGELKKVKGPLWLNSDLLQSLQ